ncbi:MAG TPA: hypothetical protein VGP05_16400 [Pseudonocardia sp.]|jgi:hypothetical protein|nr:hypothetical protein [Pseudonocardia sp.]
MRFVRRAGETDEEIRAAASVVDEARGRQATLVVASHSTDAEDCIELLAMLGLRGGATVGH